LVICRAENRKQGGANWLCKCDCGKETIVQAGSLKNNHTRSCGCERCIWQLIKARTKHGCSRGNAEYRAWQHMKKRCFDKNNKNYNLYGGRGITVYKDWIDDFSAFYAHIGKKPTEKHSLDRFPNKNGNYEPNNVRWATQFQQMQNVKQNVELELNGKTMVLAEWGRFLNVNASAISFHLKNGRTIEQIVAHYKYKKEHNLTYLKWQ